MTINTTYRAFMLRRKPDKKRSKNTTLLLLTFYFVSGCLTRVSTFTPASRCRSLTLRHLSYFLTSSDGVSLVINTPSCHITASQEMYGRNFISIIYFMHHAFGDLLRNRFCVCGKREKNVKSDASKDSEKSFRMNTFVSEHLIF